jgi:hypothetical protein
MKNRPSANTLILFALVFVLAACGPAAPVTPQQAVETKAPTSASTATAEPEIAHVPTEIVEEQPSSTTEVPVQTTCKGTFKDDLKFYPIPSDALPGRDLSAGAYVDIIGELNEPVWYQVKLLNQIGWVLQAHVRLEDEECRASQPSLVEVLGLQGTPVIEDTFRDSQNWYLVYAPDQRVVRLPNSVDNYTLNADGYFQRTSLSAPALETVGTFELETVYWRQNGGDEVSYVGIQYGNETQYFEARVYGNCEIVVLTSDGFDEKQITRFDERNSCKDRVSDLLFVRWDGSGILQVGFNEFDQPYRFNFGEGVPPTGQIQLVAEGARVQFDFIAVTEN